MSSYQYCKARVLETTTTEGSGVLQLLGAPLGYRTFWQAFAAQGQSSALCYYAVVDIDGSCEYGLGEINSAGQLDRIQPFMVGYALGGSPLTLGEGTKNVFCPYPPEACLHRGSLPLPLNETTPSVLNGSVFIEANSSSTSITYFDDGIDGKEITILFTTTNTTIVHGTNLKLSGGSNFTSTGNDTMRLIRILGVWYEKSRSVNA